jgi:glycolate oxidase iron-sulfur subunit
VLTDDGGTPLASELPEGARFIGRLEGASPAWPVPTEAPSEAGLASCVACGLCLPHCPTYRLTGEEGRSPRGRIAAMRAVDDGVATVDATFERFLDTCLGCRACEDVCPSHVPFGSLLEHARVQIEPARTRRERFVRWLGLDVALPHRSIQRLAALVQPLARPLLPRRVREIVPRRARAFGSLPRVTEPSGEARGTVALLAGCVQDRWFRDVHESTIRVLARNGWRVVVPRDQVCCGALPAHYGRLDTARRLARKNVRAFAGVDVVLANASGCGAHLAEVGPLLGTDDAARFGECVADVMAFLAANGVEPPASNPGVDVVAYHDACHALRVQKLHPEPRSVLRQIPGLEVVDLANGDRCCGAAGLYNVLEPELSRPMRDERVEAIGSSGARVVASANPGCTMQLLAGVREAGLDVEVVHPVQLLDRAYAASASA